MDKLNQGYVYFEEVNQGILRKIGKNLKILDAGCGYGTLGEVLAQKGNVVDGLDISPVAVAEAKKRLHFVAVADLTKSETIPEAISRQKYDVIVLADILEHVYDPMSILSNVKPLLKGEGKLLVSVPNIANWLSRLQLLFGHWDYQVSGIMDRTHIRFFTLRTIKRLLQAAGFTVEDVSVTPYFLRAGAVIFRGWLFPDSNDRTPKDPQALMNSPFYKFYLKYFYPVETFLASLWKRMFAYQFILVAVPISMKDHP